MRLNKTLMLNGAKDNFDKTDMLAINRDLENIFSSLQRLQTKRYEVTGSRGGNLALASLLTALENLEIIKDSTTA